MEKVDGYLTRQFGVQLRTLKRLPRYYEYPEASLHT
jgi:hypothetical protein